MDRRAAVALIAVAATLWGTSFPANKFGLDATDAWTFLFVRFFIAFVACAALATARGGLDARWLRNKWLWSMAVFNALSYQLQFLGQQTTSPGTASLMVNVGNLAVPFFAYLVHGERLQGVKAPALLLGVVGVLLVGTGGDPTAVVGGTWVGNALTLLAGLSFALVIVLNKTAVEGKGLVSLVAWTFGLTALFSLPGALLLGSFAVPPPALAAAAYTGLFCSVGAFLAWSAALRHVSAVVSGLIMLLEIVVALVLSAALGLEVLDAARLAGAGCILGAIYLASQAPASAATPADPATQKTQKTAQE